MLGKFIIRGQKQLKGQITVSGSKNSSVAILPAALLVEGKCIIENIPKINDVNVLVEIMKSLGAEVSFLDEGTISIDSNNINGYRAPYEKAKSIRASYYLLGALAGRFGKAEVAFPGGCDFGFRPIDQHIKGLEALGAKVEIEHGIVKVSCDKLRGNQIYLDVVSVGATINLMIAAVKAEGQTIIENAAKEPHVVDIANFLNAMGANIKGAGTDVIKIKGVDKLKGGAVHSIIPDQIEAGTFMAIAAASGEDVTINNIIPKHMESFTAKLIEMNIGVIEGEDSIRIVKKGEISRANIKTLPYPGFPTDLHPPVVVLLSMAQGTSTVTEGVWDLRFKYVDELKRMGARIKVEGRMAIVEGGTKFSGAPVKASDLRSGAALVIAGLISEGETCISNIKHIDRGYEKLEEKLRSLGADIERKA